GDGTIREILFLRSRKVSIVSERRRYPPYGLAGGSPGVRGRNLLIRSDGSRRELGGKAQLTVKRGDRIVIKTPGGGGYGKGSPPHR
ncbi:MAG: hydantoinase B/oxoprolinase family protein, partial [Fidelibacterota bacterium]